jgi:hypothetical protein
MTATPLEGRGRASARPSTAQLLRVLLLVAIGAICVVSARGLVVKRTPGSAIHVASAPSR